MLSAATTAQEQIQTFFSNVDGSSEEAKLDQTMGVGGAKLPSSFVLDFVNFRILLEDGTVVGGG